MKEKMLLLIIAVVMVEVVAIVFLGLDIYKKHTLPAASIIPLSKENLLFSKDGEFPDFYEPIDNDKYRYVPPWLPYEPNITVNLDTLNERFDYTIDKPDNTFRIITLGDSFTFGLNVHTKDNYPEKLEDLLNTRLRCAAHKKFEVINLGVSGYDIQYSVERFRRRGQKYNPDLVLWLLTPGDFHEITAFVRKRMKEYKIQMVEKDELDAQAKFERPSKAFSKAKAEKTSEAFSKAKEDIINEFGKENLSQFQGRALYKIDDYYKKQLVIFSLLSRSVIFEEHRLIIQDFVRARNNTSFYESAVDLIGDGRVLPDGHLSITGYALIAEDLFDYLTTNKLIPCD